jgi:hypothetical protein
LTPDTGCASLSRQAQHTQFELSRSASVEKGKFVAHQDRKKWPYSGRFTGG